MRRRPTIHEQVWPKDSSFDALKAWPSDFGKQVLNRVWVAFDKLSDDVLGRVQDWSNLEHVERTLTDLHYDKIVELLTGEEPFTPTREVPDFESRKSAKAMPRSNDFGFKIRGGDLSLVWPLEAKFIANLNRVAAYISDLNDKYLACQSSPFSPEAGLIGYIYGVDGESLFEQIELQIGQKPAAMPEFPNRNHRTSTHVRAVPQGKRYPKTFRCHHLLMMVSGDNKN